MNDNKLCYQRFSICDTLDDGFVEVTRWHNGLGFDVKISTALGSRAYEMTDDEWELLRKLADELIARREEKK